MIILGIFATAMTKRSIRYGIGIAIAVLAIALYFIFDPEDTTNAFPKCPLYSLTGWKCAGCGLQRAIHDLLHLDIRGAAHHNALFIVALPVICFYLVVEIKKSQLPRLYAFANHTMTIATLVITVLAWWVLRNIYGW